MERGDLHLYKFVRGILYPLIYLLFRPRIEGMENFPLTGRAIVYANHISALDPVVIACILPRPVRFMAKVELFRNPVLAWLLKKLGAFPVKRGTPDLSAIKNSLKILNDGEVFGMFPEGTRSKDGKLQDFTHGIASIAHKSKATVVPVAIIDKYKYFKPLKLRIGKPIRFDSYFIQKSNNQLLSEMAVEMGQAIKKMMG